MDLRDVTCQRQATMLNGNEGWLRGFGLIGSSRHATGTAVADSVLAQRTQIMGQAHRYLGANEHASGNHPGLYILGLIRTHRHERIQLKQDISVVKNIAQEDLLRAGYRNPQSLKECIWHNSAVYVCGIRCTGSQGFGTILPHQISNDQHYQHAYREETKNTEDEIIAFTLSG